jgi:hypothetical protein
MSSQPIRSLVGLLGSITSTFHPPHVGPSRSQPRTVPRRHHLHYRWSPGEEQQSKDFGLTLTMMLVVHLEETFSIGSDIGTRSIEAFEV